MNATTALLLLSNAITYRLLLSLYNQLNLLVSNRLGRRDRRSNNLLYGDDMKDLFTTQQTSMMSENGCENDCCGK